jgi:thiosulfate dehydrogenase [quinone] large subunit
MATEAVHRPRQSEPRQVSGAASIVNHLKEEAGKDRSYLVPLRVFIGIGWLRAFAEKATDPGWRDGTSLSDYLNDRVLGGDIPFPSYKALVTGVFLPHATVLGWIVMIGQVLAGLAILTGSLTRMALLGGLFMNLNFLLAGAPDPSAFYIVIQIVLLLANAGAVLGLDAHLGTLDRSTTQRGGSGPGWIWPGTVAVLSLGVAGFALAHATDWGPAGSVHDPAVILAVLALMGAGWAVIAGLRAGPRRLDGTSTRHRLIAAPLIPESSDRRWAAKRQPTLPG